MTEGYRRIRNTLRFLLANLSDFDYAKHALPAAEWLEIDRYAVAFSAQLQTELLAHYEKYEFHPVVAKLQTYCSEDLGGFYLDVLKDRLYTSAPASPARRSAQTALYHITHGLLRVLAPFLSFTAEEAWKVFQPASETIFTETYYAYPGDRRRGRAAREVDAAARGARRRDQGAGGSAQREPDRLVAAGRGRASARAARATRRSRASATT